MSPPSPRFQGIRPCMCKIKHMTECTDGNFAKIISQADTLIAIDGNIAIQLNESFICMYYTQMAQHKPSERASQHRQETQLEIE